MALYGYLSQYQLFIQARPQNVRKLIQDTSAHDWWPADHMSSMAPAPGVAPLGLPLISTSSYWIIFSDHLKVVSHDKVAIISGVFGMYMYMYIYHRNAQRFYVSTGVNFQPMHVHMLL